jgi:hypothetical protein
MNNDIEYAEEVVGNSIVRTPGTRWKHPGGPNTLRFEINIRGPIENPQIQGKWLPRLTRKYIFLGNGCQPEIGDHDATVVAFGESVLISSEHDIPIQKLDPTRSFIMNGLCPQLVKVVQGTATRTKLHPAIDPSVAPRVAPDGAPDAGRAARLLARAARGAA